MQLRPTETPELACPEPGCGGSLILGRNVWGLVYACSNSPKCSARHSAHQATGEPMGTPGTKEVREARIRAHESFDLLWKQVSPWQKTPPPMTRKAAYAWMRQALKLTKDEAHIGQFTVERCEALIAAVKAINGKVD